MTHLKRANTLQTLDRGLQILELLTRSELGPTDLARALDIERTAVHRILRTLMQRGFVERVSANGYYRANLRHLLALTGELATSREQNWLTLAKSHLEELRVATGLSANLCMPGGKEMVYLMQALAVKDLVVNSPPGTRRPLYSSAVGKAYLASLPEPELNALLATLELRPLTPRTITSATTLKEHLLKARARGYYIDDGECNLSIICVAAPIFDRFGRPIASIGVSGPREAPAFERMAELGALIVDKAKSISVVLGYDADQAENRSSQQSQSARTSYRRSEKDP